MFIYTYTHMNYTCIYIDTFNPHVNLERMIVYIYIYTYKYIYIQVCALFCIYTYIVYICIYITITRASIDCLEAEKLQLSLDLPAD